VPEAVLTRRRSAVEDGSVSEEQTTLWSYIFEKRRDGAWGIIITGTGDPRQKKIN
jgi:hypothetical protein